MEEVYLPERKCRVLNGKSVGQGVRDNKATRRQDGFGKRIMSVR